MYESREDRFAIENRLLDDMHRARTASEKAAAEFQKVMDQLRSSALANDGARTLQKAAAEREKALTCYQEAVNRYSDFVMRGVLPDDSTSRE